MSDHPWKDRITKGMILGAVFYLGWFSAITYFKVPGHWRHDKAVAVVVPALTAEVKQATKACEANAGAAMDNDADVRDLTKCPRVARSSLTEK